MVYRNFMSGAALLFAALPMQTASAEDAPVQPLREVNITAGSAAGWIPSVELEAQAKSAWSRYRALIEAQDYQAAYKMMSAGLQGQLPEAEFVAARELSRSSHGSLLQNTLTKITWTKDSDAAPAPGVFVAIDASAKFENVDRHCGYTILHKAPDSDTFVISRVEDNILDNTAAKDIAKKSDALQVDLIWRLLARNCPNYTPPPLPDSVADGVGFASVEEARRSLDGRDGLETKVENGWTIIADEKNLTVWSFAPQGAATYPAVIKRWVEPKGPQTSRMSMSILCEVEKPLCDALFDEMALRNGFTQVTVE